MRLTKIAAAVAIVGGVGFGAVTVGAPIASAMPAAPLPEKPGNGNGGGGGHGGGGNYCPPWCGEQGHEWNQQHGWNDGNKGLNDWNDKGAWWANNRHDWWDDRQGPPPWGWGPPPAYHWNGGPLPQTINYYGYNASPVWNGGQWGIWLFGLWIPIFGVGVA